MKTVSPGVRSAKTPSCRVMMGADVRILLMIDLYPEKVRGSIYAEFTSMAIEMMIPKVRGV